MAHFLINSSVCLFVFWLFYKLALENTSWHHWKRFYLIGSLGISLVIPFIVVDTIIVPIPENTLLNFVNQAIPETSVENSGFEINWFYVWMSVYSLGVVIMFYRFGKNLYSFKINHEDEVSNYSIYQLILRKGITVPHSFFNRIFASANDYKENLIPEVVLKHEKAHLDQKHSLDIILIELLLVFLWFNPLLYIVRYSMKLNHEFLADHSVIQQGISTTQYQELILQHATSIYQHAMANTFHFPIIKKRFSIMKTQTSKTNGLIRILAIIPIIALLILSCGKEETEFEVEKQKTILEEQELILEKEKFIIREYGKTEVIEVLENLTPEDIVEYNRLAKKHKVYMDENASLIVWKNKTAHMQTIFYSMNEEQKANNEPWPYLGKVNDLKAGQIPPPPPPAPAPPVSATGEFPPPPPAPKNIQELMVEVENGKTKVFIDEQEQSLKQLKDIVAQLDDKKDLAFSSSSIVTKMANGVMHYNFTNISIKKTDREAEFQKWRFKNNRTASFPTPIDHIDFYGNTMHYYIDGEKVNSAKAKYFIQKQGNKGVQIMPINGVNSLKMTSRL